MKNCPVCGAQLQDTDMVCPVCGAQVGAQEAYDQGAQQFQQGVVDPAMQYQQDMGGMAQQYGVDPYTQPQGVMPEAPKSGNGKKIAIIAGIAVAVVAIALVLIFVVFKKGSGADSPKEVAQRCVDALFDGDSDEVFKCFPDGMITSDEKAQLESVLQYMTMFKSMIKSVKAGSETKITGSEADEYISKIKSEYNITVDEVATVPITYEMEFMGQSEKQTMDVVCGKVDGKWYVIGGIN